MYIKKIVSTVISIALFGSVIMTGNAFSIQNDGLSDIEIYARQQLDNYQFPDDELYAQAEENLYDLLNDRQFLLLIEADIETARITVDKIIRQVMINAGYFERDNPSIVSSGTRNLSNNIYYLPNYITPFQQSNSYYCGPASTIMAQIGNGSISNVALNYGSSAQVTMATALNTTSTNGTDYSEISNYLRANNSTSYNAIYMGDIYDDENGSINATGYDIIGYIKQSLQLNKTPVILSYYYSYFPYFGWNKETTGHYFVVTQVNDNGDVITVLDPYNNSSYSGYHTMSYEDFVCGIDKGYLISAADTSGYLA